MRLRGETAEAGRWAATYAALEAKDDGAFAMTGAQQRKGQLKSADFTGAFDLRDAETGATRSVDEPILTLHFEAAAAGARAVSGRGRNEFGAFKLKGSLDERTDVLHCTKK